MKCPDCGAPTMWDVGVGGTCYVDYLRCPDEACGWYSHRDDDDLAADGTVGIWNKAIVVLSILGVVVIIMAIIIKSSMA